VKPRIAASANRGIRVHVEVVLGLPVERLVHHLLCGQAGGHHRPPQRRARADRDRLRLDAGLLERARHAAGGDAGAAAARQQQPHLLVAQRRDRPRLERREDVGLGPVGAVDQGQRQQRAARRAGGVDVLGEPLAQRTHVIEPRDLLLQVEGVEGVEQRGHGRARAPEDRASGGQPG
jgi:hypothetical protein